MAEQRYKAVLAVIADGRAVSEVAHSWGVSRQTVHDWLVRYEQAGLEGLVDRSHRPGTCPHQMPDEAIVLEQHARNIGENFTLTRELPDPKAYIPSQPTSSAGPTNSAGPTRRVANWPELDFICSSRSQSLQAYMESIGDDDKVLNMLVGDTQRIWVYAEQGFAVPQEVPRAAMEAYKRLTVAGCTRRLVGPDGA